MSKLAQERLAVVVVAAIFAASRAIAPVWTIEWTSGRVSSESYWIWERPELTPLIESAQIHWLQTSVPVAGAVFAGVFLWWFLGVGDRQAD